MAHQVNYLDYLRAIGHDLGAPLRHVRGFSGLLAEEIGDQIEGEAGLLLRQVQESAELAEKMLHGLYDIAMLERCFRPAPADSLARLTLRALDGLSQPLIESRIEGDARACVDERQYQRLVRCLAENVQQYAETPSLTIYVSSQPEAVRVDFVSGRPGIDPLKWEKALCPFNRLGARPTVNSPGLGLTTVAQISSLHNAQLSCEAESDGSMRIRIVFPDE